MSLHARIETAITQAGGRNACIRDSRSVAGGSINDSRIVILQDDREYYVKSHVRAADYPGMFQAEYEALVLIAAAAVIRVPVPVACAEDFIVMEVIRQGERRHDWCEMMGRQLALLHQKTQHEKYGFDRANYLGTTQQINSWSENWLDFWREQRLGWQLQLYSRKTMADDPLLEMGDLLLARMEDFLGEINEPAVLLHGDLWSGNAAADETGTPVIFDPACYFGHREAELGMMRLFGGFGPVCEAAYAEVWPLQAGSEERICLYRLYHELNHLNLFGRSYYQTCVNTIKSLL
jgi:fructosamine-3-kinase